MTVLNDIGHGENPSARIVVIPVPQTTPGQCGICGNGRDSRGFADLGLDFEYWGRLILCADCAGEIAALFGYISSSTYEELLGERDLAVLQLHEANDKLASLGKAFDGLSDFRNYFPHDTISTGDSSSLETPKQEDEPIIGNGESSIPELTDLDKSDAIEQRKTGKSSGKPGLLNI